MNPQSYAMWQRLMAQLKQSAPAQFIGGARDMLLPEKMSDIVTGPAYAMRHPIESAKMLGGALQDASQSNFEKMFAAPSLMEKVGYGAAGAIPAIGPVAAMAGEEFGAGNTARGLGMSAALLGPSMYGGAKAGARFGREAANEIMAARMELAKANAMPPPRIPPVDAAATLPQRPMVGAVPSNLQEIVNRGWDDVARYDKPPAPPISHPPLDPVLPPPLSAPVPEATLPTRRDALKAGGAVAAAAMVPKLLAPASEAAKVAEVPVLGRAAPSALGREGFYRETKNRVGLDVYDQNDVITKVGNVPVGSDSYAWDLIDDSTVRSGGGPHKLFLTRVLGEDGKTYGKTITKIRTDMDRQHLKEALKRAVSVAKDDTAQEWDTFGGRRSVGSTPLQTSRIVHSEITPEAALRLNTIEKPKIPLLDHTWGGKNTAYFEVPGNTNARVGPMVNMAVNKKTGKPLATSIKRLNKELGHLGYSGVDEFDLTQVPKEEALAMSKEGQPSASYSRWLFNDLDGVNTRPKTVGISPRYTKRVSIRLLKDTMAKQIAENKRAAGKGKTPPPLLAKPPVLQDNPALSRFEFLRGKK